MEISDLIAIGKLSKNNTQQGFVTLRENSEFREEFLELHDLFLVFTDHRVRLVTLEQINIENRIMLKFIETDVVQEALLDPGARLMIAREDIGKFDSIEESNQFLDHQVFFKGNRIGKVTDSFFNSAHHVLIIELNDGKEVMIPLVDYFLEKVEKDQIHVHHIEDLLNL
ncbi:MAG: hypothetical protein JW996_00295 [Candidatus Cloacimonetes bacterium]|nr:hypothetical protein [Candidatus Cloacimonadota bacterium]